MLSETQIRQMWKARDESLVMVNRLLDDWESQHPDKTDREYLLTMIELYKQREKVSSELKLLFHILEGH